MNFEKLRDFIHPNSPIEKVLKENQSRATNFGRRADNWEFGIKDVLNAFLKSMLKYAIYGVFLVSLIGILFYVDGQKKYISQPEKVESNAKEVAPPGGKPSPDAELSSGSDFTKNEDPHQKVNKNWLFGITTDLSLDGETLGGLIALIVGIAISVGGAMVAIMISWRSMEISKEIKILEEQARDRDDARFFFDMASDVKKELDNLSERWLCYNKKIDDFFVEAKKLRETLEREFCKDISGYFPDLNLSRSWIGRINNLGDEFEKSAKDFCVVLKESGASLVSDPDFDYSRRSDYFLAAYIFSMRWKLSNISAFEKWKAEKQSSRSEFDWPDFSQISEVYSESRDEQIDFVFGLATIAFSLSKCRDEVLDTVALVGSSLQAVKNITWFEDGYLQNSIKKFYFDQVLISKVIDKSFTMGNYRSQYRPKCYSVVSDLAFPGDFDFGGDPSLMENFRRFFFSCFVWGEKISWWNEFRDNPTIEILSSMKDWSRKIESASGALKMREFLKGFEGVDCDSSIALIKEIKNNLKERYETYPSSNDANRLKRKIGGELDIPDF